MAGHIDLHQNIFSTVIGFSKPGKNFIDEFVFDVTVRIKFIREFHFEMLSPDALCIDFNVLQLLFMMSFVKVLRALFL